MQSAADAEKLRAKLGRPLLESEKKALPNGSIESVERFGAFDGEEALEHQSGRKPLDMSKRGDRLDFMAERMRDLVRTAGRIWTTYTISMTSTTASTTWPHGSRVTGADSSSPARAT